jgi:hypothetical protein
VVAPLALAAAAAVALVAVQRMREPEPRPTVDLEIAHPSVLEAPALAIRVSAIVGAAEAVDMSGTSRAVTLDTVLAEGFTVQTGPASELHLVLGESAVVSLPADSQLLLSYARDRDVHLVLQRGRVVSAVRPLAPGGQYRVSAREYQVAVRGTHYSVAIEELGVGVQVDEGWVVLLRDGEMIADLRAPERWSEARGGLGGATERERLVRPREPGRGFPGWPVLHIPAWPRVVSWEIDGARLAGSGELAMRVPPGGLDIVALLQNGRRMKAHIEVDALGARFDPRELVLVGAVSAERPATPAPDPAQAAAVIRAAHPDLQRCYERSLRNGPSGPGPQAARLRLHIDGSGKVRSVELGATEELPALLADCIRTVAGRWQFPAPGGAGIAFEAPIRFQPRN